MNTVASLTAIVNSLPTAIVMIDADGNMALVNLQTERLFGYSRDELIGKPVEILVPSSFRSGLPALRAGYGDKLDDEGKDFLYRIRASSQRMGHLIDELRSSSP